MKAKTCPVCLAYLYEEDDSADQHIFDYGGRDVEIRARRHGYERVGSMGVNYPSYLPKAFLKTSTEQGIYAPKRFADMSSVLLKAYYTLRVEERVDVATRNEYMKEWMLRICMDEEAHAVYISLLESTRHLETPTSVAVERVAEIFDLPDFKKVRR